MKALLALAARFDALTRRERILVSAGIIAAILFLAYFIGIEPALATARAENKRIETARVDLTNVNAQIAALGQRADPDAANRQALAQINDQLASGNAKLRKMEENMVPPGKMRAFLESLLARHRQVELISLKTLPPSPVFSSTAAEIAAPAVQAIGPNIYKHGVEISIAGRYEDLLAYLTELERLPQRILWNKVTLSVDAYPRSILTVTVYTLSLDKEWLTL